MTRRVRAADTPRTVAGTVAGTVAVAVVLAVVVASGSSCGSPGGTDRTGAPGRSLVVFAASSLAAPFEELASAFESERPGLDVRVNPGSSATLAAQIGEGAPADVFASAAAGPMDRVRDRAVDPTVFATDDLVVAVPRGDPGGVSATADLSREELRVGLCAPAVPCGDYARRILAAAGVVPSVDTEEPDAASLLAKVRSGDLDAAILYRSQVAAAAPAVESVELEPPSRVRAEYLIAALRSVDGSPPSADATAFVEYVLGPGRSVLDSDGLGPP